MDIPVTQVRWQPCYRIIPSRFPPIALFEAVADPADLEAVFQIEAMTNDRLREEAGRPQALGELEPQLDGRLGALGRDAHREPGRGPRRDFAGGDRDVSLEGEERDGDQEGAGRAGSSHRA